MLVQLGVQDTPSRYLAKAGILYIIVAIVVQVKQQLVDTEQDYDRLQNTPFVTRLGITLGDLKWAADMATSRSFAVPKGLGGTALEVCLLCYRHITNIFCMMLTTVHSIVRLCFAASILHLLMYQSG